MLLFLFLPGLCAYHSSCIKTDSTVRFYGSEVKVKQLNDHLGLALDDDEDTCMNLPTRDSDTTPHYFWMSVDMSMFGANNRTGSFIVDIGGQGIACNSKTGPQVTRVGQVIIQFLIADRTRHVHKFYRSFSWIMRTILHLTVWNPYGNTGFYVASFHSD